MKTEDLHKHTCKITGKGMSKGYMLDHNTYKNQKDIVEILRKDYISAINADINIGYIDGYDGEDALGGGLVPKTISDDNLLKFSYDNDYHYWTEWYDNEELEEDGEAYDDNGNIYYFENGEWVREINLDEDYEICGGDGLENEVWRHKSTGEQITVDIIITRSFNGRIID